MGSLTKDDLVSSIRKVMTDENIQQPVHKMHNLFTDHEYDKTPMERGVKSVEYVLKHKRLDFLKPVSTMNMPWYQYHGYDIFVFVILLIFFILFIFYRVFIFCTRL